MPEISASKGAHWHRSDRTKCCIACGDTKPLKEKVHVDHKTPLARGGKHVFDNLQILDAIENMRKGAREANA